MPCSTASADLDSSGAHRSVDVEKRLAGGKEGGRRMVGRIRGNQPYGSKYLLRFFGGWVPGGSKYLLMRHVET